MSIDMTIDFSLYEECILCPRLCRVNRKAQTGLCGCTHELTAARAALHPWEEPCISGTKNKTAKDDGINGGSGTVFFTGCTLRCCFCQNFPISHEHRGKVITAKKLSAVFLSLQQQEAYNINLVTPTQFLPHIVRALEISRPELTIPVIYNCGGYERTEIIDALKDKVQIYMPDLKYFSPVLSKRYSQAENYFSVASRAVLRMIEQTGPPLFDPQTGLLKRGVLLRHMVLPGAREDSIKLLHWIKNHLPEKGFLISLMSQYTPFYQAKNHPEINRRITTYEYQKVIDEALRLGLTDGFMQEKSSAKEEYTPPFSTLEGL